MKDQRKNNDISQKEKPGKGPPKRRFKKDILSEKKENKNTAGLVSVQHVVTELKSRINRYETWLEQRQLVKCKASLPGIPTQPDTATQTSMSCTAHSQ